MKTMRKSGILQSLVIVLVCVAVYVFVGKMIGAAMEEILIAL